MSPRLKERLGRPVDPGVARGALAAVDALRSLPEVSLQALAEEARIFDVPPGVDVINQGRFPSGFFVVLEGALEVYATDLHSDEPAKVNEIGVGAHLGEIGLIEGMPSTATVRTAARCLIVRFSGGRFLSIISEAPEVLAHLLGEMSGSMARTDPRYRSASAERVPTKAESRTRSEDLAPIVGEAERLIGGVGDYLDRLAETGRAVFDASACYIALLEGRELVVRGAAGEGAEVARGQLLDSVREQRLEGGNDPGMGPTEIGLESPLGPIGAWWLSGNAWLADPQAGEVMRGFTDHVTFVIEAQRLVARFVALAGGPSESGSAPQ